MENMCEVVYQTDIGGDMWFPHTSQPLPYELGRQIAHILSGNMNVRAVKIIRIEIVRTEEVVKSQSGKSTVQ